MLGWCPNSETSVISRKVAMAIAAAMNHFRDHPISGQRGRSGARPGKDHPWDGKKSQKEREASYRPINVTGYYDSAGSIMLYPSSSTSWSTFPPFFGQPHSTTNAFAPYSAAMQTAATRSTERCRAAKESHVEKRSVVTPRALENDYNVYMYTLLYVYVCVCACVFPYLFMYVLYVCMYCSYVYIYVCVVRM